MLGRKVNLFGVELWFSFRLWFDECVLSYVQNIIYGWMKKLVMKLPFILSQNKLKVC